MADRDNQKVKHLLQSLVSGDQHVHYQCDDAVEHGEDTPGHKVLGRSSDSFIRNWLCTLGDHVV